MVTPPIDGGAATHGNGSTVGFVFDSPEEVDAWHAAGVAAGGTAIEIRPASAEAASGRCISLICAIPMEQAVRASSYADGIGVEIVSEAQSHGGRQLVVKHASRATRPT